MISPLTPSEMKKRLFPVSQGVFVFGAICVQKISEVSLEEIMKTLKTACKQQQKGRNQICWSLYRKTVLDPCSRNPSEHWQRKGALGGLSSVPGCCFGVPWRISSLLLLPMETRHREHRFHHKEKLNDAKNSSLDARSTR